jgi:hypothetical protein
VLFLISCFIFFLLLSVPSILFSVGPVSFCFLFATGALAFFFASVDCLYVAK